MSKLLRRAREFIAGGFAESVDSKCEIYNRFARDNYKKEKPHICKVKHLYKYAALSQCLYARLFNRLINKKACVKPMRFTQALRYSPLSADASLLFALSKVKPESP